MRTISLHVADYLDPKQYRVLLKSNRCYRNLTLEWTESSKLHFIVDVLEKFGPELSSLKLSTYVVTPLVLVRFLRKAPNLNELIIEGSFCSEGCDVIPTFKNLRVLELTQRGFEDEICKIIPRMFPNVTSLDLVAAENAAFDLILQYGKQLKCLHVLLEYSYFVQFCTLDCLSNLRRLYIYWPQSADFKVSVESFYHMELLESASLTGALNENIFDTVCKKWQHLEHLCINIQSMKAVTFRKITQLGKLRTLKIQGSIREGNFLKDVQLPKISHLVLDGISTSNNFYGHLASFVPNVRYLKIYDHTFENAHLRLLCTTLTSLRALSLDYCYQVKDDGFQFLNRLTNLIELQCWSIPMSENAFLKFPKCRNLRTFSVGGSGWITNKAILDIPTVFPNLIELQIIDCTKVDEDTIWTLQKQMKKCSVVKLEKPEFDTYNEAVWQKCW
ncbi:uncharacterized protein LOC129724473 isoform X2 [Wyeomyia smithii]|nr:uncharacterized protein LOC129724473 isoform X2 [Wyeomyia smithii]